MYLQSILYRKQQTKPIFECGSIDPISYCISPVVHSDLCPMLDGPDSSPSGLLMYKLRKSRITRDKAKDVMMNKISCSRTAPPLHPSQIDNADGRIRVHLNVTSNLMVKRSKEQINYSSFTSRQETWH